MDSKRKKNLEFHIKKDNYFSTLATVFELLRQNINPFSNSKERKSLEREVEELKYMQKHYKIIKK